MPHPEHPKPPAEYNEFKEITCLTANGRQVYINPQEPHLKTHLEGAPNLYHLLPSAIAKVIAESDNVYTDVDMGQDLAPSDLVEIIDADVAAGRVFYAQREGRDTYTRFVSGREREWTRHIALVVKQIKATHQYYLKSAWFGRAVPQTPDDPEYGGTKESFEFWEGTAHTPGHALIAGCEPIKDDSITHTRPW